MVEKEVLRIAEDNGLLFICPGCNNLHRVQHGIVKGVRYDWDGNMIAPTITPDIVLSWTIPDPDNFDLTNINKKCHFSIENGIIHFYGDCTHLLAGYVIEMIPFNKYDL